MYAVPYRGGEFLARVLSPWPAMARDVTARLGHFWTPTLRTIMPVPDRRSSFCSSFSAPLRSAPLLAHAGPMRLYLVGRHIAMRVGVRYLVAQHTSHESHDLVGKVLLAGGAVERGVDVLELEFL